MFINLFKTKQLFFLTVLIVTSFSPSCASQEERLALAKQEVEIINSKLDKSEMITGLIFRGEKRYHYRAYFVDEKLVYIFSDMNVGIRSASTNFYYFQKGDLLYFKKDEVGFDPANVKRKMSVKSEIYFDGDDVLESVKTVRGEYDEITQEELDEILEEAKKLYEAAIEKKASSK